MHSTRHRSVRPCAWPCALLPGHGRARAEKLSRPMCCTPLSRPWALKPWWTCAIGRCSWPPLPLAGAGARKLRRCVSSRSATRTRLQPIRRSDSGTLTCLTLSLGRTKTGDNETGQSAILAGGPADALLAWLERSGIRSGPVFRAIDRWGNLKTRTLDSQSVNLILKARLKTAGLDPADYSAHGLRSGYLTEAARQACRCQRPWPNRATDPSSRLPATTTRQSGSSDGRLACFCKLSQCTWAGGNGAGGETDEDWHRTAATKQSKPE